MHFTRIENVDSIVRHGLIGRNTLGLAGIGSLFNDQNRYDYQPDAICLTISFPNYKMFYALRQKDLNADWAVIRLRPEIVRDKRCAFSHVNAATRTIAHTAIEDRMRKSALESMFADHEGMPTRAVLKIPDSYPTDPQAEVLSLDTIEPQYFRDILFNAKHLVKDSDKVHALAREHSGKTKFLYGPQFFAPRSDWVHWKGM